MPPRGLGQPRDPASVQHVGDLGGVVVAAADAHLEHGTQRWRRGGDRRRRGVVREEDAVAFQVAEVDQHVGPLGRSQHQPAHRYGAIPQTSLGADLPHVGPGQPEAENAGVAAVEDPQPVQPWLDVEVWPHLAVDEHHIAEVLADPGGAGDVARRVPEGAVAGEEPVLDYQWDLERPRRQAVGIVWRAGVELVAQHVRAGQPRNNVQPGRPESVVMEPLQPRAHVRRRIWIQHTLCLAVTEPVRRHGRIPVAVRGDEAAMKVRHDPHVTAERGEARIHGQPRRIHARQLVRVVDACRRAVLAGEHDPE
jgi:hypothetical protein